VKLRNLTLKNEELITLLTELVTFVCDSCNSSELRLRKRKRFVLVTDEKYKLYIVKIFPLLYYRCLDKTMYNFFFLSFFWTPLMEERRKAGGSERSQAGIYRTMNKSATWTKRRHVLFLSLRFYILNDWQ
jgi:hypothetical protein